VCAFSYAKGSQPDVVHGYIFSFLVVAGNLLMNEVCNFVAHAVGFQHNDYAEVFYTLLYLGACTINVVADLWITAVVTYRQAAGMHMPTADGVPLTDLSLHELFESFAMQKALGLQTWKYNFPPSFLFPFILEPLVTLVIMRHLMKLLVRSHSELTDRQCEKALAIMAPMNMARYGDVILNVTLSTLCLFFPAGFFLKMFVALALSHLYLIVLDTYRVLRCVPSFCYSSHVIDRCAQLLLGVPCGFILLAVVVKSNCASGQEAMSGMFCVRDRNLILRMCAAFIIHLLLYGLAHWAVVAVCERCWSSSHEKAVQSFAEVAAKTPSSWFTANPVHCLRSHFMHGHSPPCVYNRPGYEHLLRANPAIACYFEEKVQLVEDKEGGNEETALKGISSPETEEVDKKMR